MISYSDLVRRFDTVRSFKVIKREIITNTFKEYTSRYDITDPKIRLKVEHTYRVAALTDEITSDIASSFKMDAHDRDLAWAIGMLHDIGRFEQVKRYQTFWDSESVDHAEFGADLLFGGEFEKDPFLAFDFDVSEKNIIEKAIRNHNKYRISEGLTEREILFCNIIRDADKIDILKVNTDFTPEEIYGVTMDELLSSSITDAVMEAALEGHAVDRAIRRTPMDTVVSHASMMQELNFPISCRIVLGAGYLDTLLDKKVKDPACARSLATIREFIFKNLRSRC